MTDRKLMQQALEALRRSRKSVSGDLDLAGCAYGSNDPDGHRYDDAKKALTTLDKAITALKEALAQSDEREQVAAWMMQRGYATGHGDTVEGLLKELEWQVAEREREACAKVVTDNAHMFATPQAAESLAAAIRARGNT